MEAKVEPKADILIVDDDLSQRRSMGMILERKGYAVTSVGSGGEALDKVRAQPFDMVFMDIKMPVMNGVEAYQAIKGLRPDAAVVMMTAYAVEDLVQQALDSGARGIIYKPLDFERVVAIIEGAKKEKAGALVLIVDDDPATCVSLQQNLERKNFSVGMAHTGDEAVALVKTAAYDVIFIDKNLPTINGAETYLQIRKVNQEAVVVMVTGHRDEMAELVRATLHGAVYATLYKPLNMAEVLPLIEEIQLQKQSRG
jgi:two-component system, NtrC family, response regulator HydG